MRTLFILSISFFAAMSQASFELMLVADKGTNSIHRFDSESGVYLGDFATGQLNNPNGMELDQANNLVYVFDQGGRISRWNYNTGVFQGSISFGGTFMAPSLDGNLLIGINTGVSRVTKAGTLLNFYAVPANSTVKSGYVGEDNRMYVLYNDSSNVGRVACYTLGGTLLLTNTWNASSASKMPGGRVANAILFGSTLYIEQDTWNVSCSYSAVMSFPGAQTYIPANGVTLGHNYIYATYGTSASTGVVSRVDPQYMSYAGSFGAGIINQPTGIAVVTAPEPSSIALLAVGAGWLIRKRKK